MINTERQAKQEAWKERIADFESSGLSGAKWCAANGIKENQLSYWRRKLKSQEIAQTGTCWLPVDLREPESPLQIRIGEAIIELRPGFNRELFITAVNILRSL